MSHEVFVSGGNDPIRQTGTSTPQEMGEQAVRLALEDSGATMIKSNRLCRLCLWGQHLWPGPFIVGNERNLTNVNNNRSTGSTALFLARQAIEGGWRNVCWHWV